MQRGRRCARVRVITALLTNWISFEDDSGAQKDPVDLLLVQNSTALSSSLQDPHRLHALGNGTTLCYLDRMISYLRHERNHLDY